MKINSKAVVVVVAVVTAVVVDVFVVAFEKTLKIYENRYQYKPIGYELKEQF